MVYPRIDAWCNLWQCETTCYLNACPNKNKTKKQSRSETWRGRLERSEGPQSQRDEKGLLAEFLFFFSCHCGTEINRPKQTSEPLRKFRQSCCWWWMCLHSFSSIFACLSILYKGMWKFVNKVCVSVNNALVLSLCLTLVIKFWHTEKVFEIEIGSYLLHCVLLLLFCLPICISFCSHL